MATWYVRPVSAEYGAEDGTTYETAFDGFADITWGAGGVVAGDTLYVCGTHTEQMTVGASGVSGSPIIIRGDYTGDAGIISGADSIGTWTQVGVTNVYQAACNWTAGVLIEDGTLRKFKTWNTDIATTNLAVEEWTLDTTGDLVYVWCSDGLDPDTHTMQIGVRDYGILATALDYITISNLQVEGANVYAINLSGDCDNDIIQSCTIQNSYCGIGAVGTTQSNISILSNTIHDTYTYGILVYQDGTGFTVSGNTIYNVKWRGDGTEASGMYFDADSSTIASNVIHDCGFTAYAEHGIYVGGSDSVVVRYNKLYSNFAHGLKFSTVTNSSVYYNLCYSNGVAGIQLEGSSETNSIYNNVIYGNTEEGIWINSASVDATTIKNNIISGNLGGSGGQQIFIANGATNTVSDYNLIYYSGATDLINYQGAGHTWVAWQAHGFDTHSINADPIFVDSSSGDYRLSNTSPAINAGVSVGLSEDYEGNTVIGVPDIGAYDEAPAISRQRKRHHVSRHHVRKHHYR